MSLHLAAVCLAVMLAATGCGGGGSESAPPPSPGAAPPSTAPSTPAPITPMGRPIATVPPSPVASIGGSCLEPADAARRVVIPLASGARITGALLGRGGAGVILVHQSDGDLCQWLPYARDLARSGYRVLDLEVEGYGSSGTAQYGGVQPWPYGLDVAAAVTYLRAQGAATVVLVGASMGGTSVLAGAAVARPPVDGVVSLSAPAEYNGIDARVAAGRLTMPVLYASAADDAADTRTLHAATKSQKALSVVPGTLHGVDLVLTGGDAAVRRAVDAFMAANTR